MPRAFIPNAQAQAGRAPLAGALTASLPEVQYVRDASESVRFIVIHCSATRRDRPYPVELLRRDHLARGFREIGYHFYIRTDGTTYHPRLLGEVGAHVKGLNHCSIGVCYEGGLDENGRPADTRTPQQRERLVELLTILKHIYPKAMIIGHNQLSPKIRKACPCFDARGEYEGVSPWEYWIARKRPVPSGSIGSPLSYSRAIPSKKNSL